MNELKFEGKQILVVGGATGMGNCVAHAFHDRGATVHVCGSNEDASWLDEAPSLEGLHFCPLDLSDSCAIDAFKPPFDRLDVLVLAQDALIIKHGEFEMANFRKVIEINLVSLMACSVKFHDMLKMSRGALVILGSTAATKDTPASNASRAGAVALTRALGEAWADDGIRVNGIAPGRVAPNKAMIATPMQKRLRRTVGKIPLKRIGSPADIAGPVLFLASPLAAYMVGQTLIVDGGLISDGDLHKSCVKLVQRALGWLERENPASANLGLASGSL